MTAGFTAPTPAEPNLDVADFRICLGTMSLDLDFWKLPLEGTLSQLGSWRHRTRRSRLHSRARLHLPGLSRYERDFLDTPCALNTGFGGKK